MHFGGNPFGGGIPGGGRMRNKDVDTTKLYETLSVEKDADQKAIKKAYRKMAVKHHPDKGGDEHFFKEVNAGEFFFHHFYFSTTNLYNSLITLSFFSLLPHFFLKQKQPCLFLFSINDPNCAPELAYEILSDPKQRKIYDQYGLEGVAQDGAPSAAGGEDLFSMFFGGGKSRSSGPRKGPRWVLLI